MRRLLIKKNPIFFLFLLITSSSLTILIFSLLRLPESTPINTGKLRADLSEEIGFFGNMMVEMLPEDLVFTAFVPSEKAFNRDLGMTKPNHNDTSETKSFGEEDNAYAVVSRILGFAVVPYRVEGGDIEKDETASYVSLSGFTLKIWRKSGGGIVVNGVEAEKMGLRRGKVIVHVMDGVIMDSDFAQSFDSFSSTTSQDEDKPEP